MNGYANSFQQAGTAGYAGRIPRLGRGALLLLAALSIGGIGCATITLQPPADQRARSQFLPDAEKGNPVAQYQLGLSYRYGTSGMPRHADEAVRWLTKAAEQGNRDAQAALGEMFLVDEGGLPLDAGKALAWLTRAAESGPAANQVWLARLLEEGRGKVLPADPDAARRWYERAAKDSRFARQRLGLMCEMGRGGSPDPEGALKWYVLAESPLDIERVEKGLSPRQRDRARAAAAEWRP